MKRIPLKDKTLQFEQDYIETKIKWGLKLGDDIFKKSDVKRAVLWLKDEIDKTSKEGLIDTNKINLLIKKAFYDVTKNKKGVNMVKKPIEKKWNESQMFDLLFFPKNEITIGKTNKTMKQVKKNKLTEKEVNNLVQEAIDDVRAEEKQIKEWIDPEQPEGYERIRFPIKVTTNDVINDLTKHIEKDYGKEHANEIKKKIEKSLKKALKKKKSVR